MYWYISFLRPPPVSVSSTAEGITITPQVANDLRTELRYDPTPISYTWQRTQPLPSSPLPSQQLTTFIPPASTYRPIPVPLPPTSKAGDEWRLGLFSNPGNTEAGPSSRSSLLRLTVDPEVLGVWSEPIRIVRPDARAQNNGAVRGLGGTTKGKAKDKEILIKGKSKGKEREREKEKDEGPKQGRIWREWTLPAPNNEVEGGEKEGDCDILRIIEQTSFDLDKKIWDSGLALSSYLYRHLLSNSRLEGAHPLMQRVLRILRAETDLRILELGSGTGLVSVALGLAYKFLAPDTKADRRITATDLESAIPLMDENLALNGLSRPSGDGSTREAEQELIGGAVPSSSGLHVDTQVLDWEQPLPDWVAKDWPQLIMRVPRGITPSHLSAADVTYNTASFPCLLSTITSLLKLPPTAPQPRTSQPPLLLLAYKERDAAERELWTLLKEQGVEMIQVDRIVGAEGDGGDGTIEIWAGGIDLAK